MHSQNLQIIFFTWILFILLFRLIISLKFFYRYHLGTLAFGSFIWTDYRIVSICMKALGELSKHLSCKCCYDCFKFFAKFLNRNPYIMCAIHGQNFCNSALYAFPLMMRNISRVCVLDAVRF